MSVRARTLIEPLRLELVKACADNAKLREQNARLKHQLDNVKAKRDHHLRERDRYRDLYVTAHKRVQEMTAKYVEF